MDVASHKLLFRTISNINITEIGEKYNEEREKPYAVRPLPKAENSPSRLTDTSD